MMSAPIASRSMGMCGADRVGGQAYGHKPGPFVDVPCEVFLVEGEGVRIYPDPPHSRTLLCGSDEPGVYVGAVVELRDDDLGAFVPLFREGTGEGEGQGRHVGPEGDLFGRGP